MARRFHPVHDVRDPEDSRAYRQRYDPYKDKYRFRDLATRAQLFRSAQQEQNKDRYIERLEGMLSQQPAESMRWPEVGDFIIPPENNQFAAHAELVQDPQCGLSFDTKKFMFDFMVAGRAQRPELFDPEHPDYARYANARMNIAALRNWHLGVAYSDDSQFDPADERRMMEIAFALGDGLYQGWGGAALNAELLNKQGDGALHAYEYLLTRQRAKGGIAADMMDNLYDLVALPKRHFNLPPVEQTPFAPERLGAPEGAAVERVPVQDMPSPARQEKKREDVKILTDAERVEAAEHGRIILDFFRNLKLHSKGMQETMDNGTPQQQGELLERLEHMLERYDSAIEQALAANPKLALRRSLQDAEDAAEALEHAVEILAEKTKPTTLSQSQQISADITETQLRHHADKLNIGQLCERLAETAQAAFADMQESQDKQTEQHEEQQEDKREAIEQAMATQPHRRGRRRRRHGARGGASATAGGFKNRRKASDINGDGVADDLQGLSQIKNPIAVSSPPSASHHHHDPAQQLNNALSKALAQSGIDPNKLAGITMKNVGDGDHIAPDDRTAKDTLADKRTREQRDPAKKQI